MRVAMLAVIGAKNMCRRDVTKVIGMHDQDFSVYVAGFVAICQTALPGLATGTVPLWRGLPAAVGFCGAAAWPCPISGRGQ